jgi:hypothetical protein
MNGVVRRSRFAWSFGSLVVILVCVVVLSGCAYFRPAPTFVSGPLIEREGVGQRCQKEPDDYEGLWDMLYWILYFAGSFAARANCGK